MPGNNIVEFIRSKDDKNVFTDPVDDTIHFKLIIDNIYKGDNNKLFILSTCSKPYSKDTFLMTEYYKDVTDFLDLKTYKAMPRGYFRNKDKVCMWWGNNDGNYPIEVTGADPKTFVAFDSIAGGKDGKHVFYAGVPGDFKIIEGADPNTIHVLNPKRGCWNCESCYFVDKRSVFYALNKIKTADPQTFRLVNKPDVDAIDNKHEYFEGRVVKKKRPAVNKRR